MSTEVAMLSDEQCEYLTKKIFYGKNYKSKKIQVKTVKTMVSIVTVVIVVVVFIFLTSI